MSKRKSTTEERDILEYLNDVRDSGVTNMFAAAPFIEDEYGLNAKEARRMLSLWMKNYNAEGDYDEIEDE